MFLKKFPMNIVSVTALGIGSMVGAGIFALLGQVIIQAGSLTYWSFAISGMVAMLSGYSYAKLASTFPDSGGLTDYYSHAFKTKGIASLFSIIYISTLAISTSMMAKSFGIYVSSLFEHAVNPGGLANYFSALLIALLVLLNMQGSSKVGRIEVLFVGLKIGMLLVLVFFAFKDVNFALTMGEVEPKQMSFWGSIGITFFAYAGFGVMTNAAEEVKKPTATIPHAIYLAILIVIVLYMALAFVVLNFIPADEMAKHADTAVAIAAQKLMGKGGYILIASAALVAFITGINANLFSQFKISKALAEQGALPAFYAKTFWHQGTWGNAFSAVLILLATLFLNFNAIVNLASAAFLVCYLATFVANWKLRQQTNSSAFLILTGLVAMSLILGAFILNIFF